MHFSTAKCIKKKKKGGGAPEMTNDCGLKQAATEKERKR